MTDVVAGGPGTQGKLGWGGQRLSTFNRAPAMRPQCTVKKQKRFWFYIHLGVKSYVFFTFSI